MSGIKLVVNVMRVGGRVGCEILTCCFLCRDQDERFRVGKKISGSTHMAGVNFRLLCSSGGGNCERQISLHRGKPSLTLANMMKKVGMTWEVKMTRK